MDDGQTSPLSRRREDMAAEQALARFLDLYLYGRFPETALRSVRRVRDRAQQLSGTDVLLTAPDGRVLHVDEKAQLHYLNKDLPTFAFELGFLRQGRWIAGWLCSEALRTDLYLLVWPFASRDRCAGLRTEEIHRRTASSSRKSGCCGCSRRRASPCPG